MDFNKKCSTTFDKIVLQSDDEDKKTNKQCRDRSHSCKQKKINTSSTERKFPNQQSDIDCCSDKNISDQIHVKRKNFICIINLNTTVYEHKFKYGKKHDRKERYHQSHFHKVDKTNHFDSNYYVNKKERIVPKCFRQVCVNSKFNVNRRHYEILRRRNTDRTQYGKERVLSEDEAQHIDRREERKKHLHHKCKHYKQKYIQKKAKLSSHLKDGYDNLTYEDLSSSSLEYETYLNEHTPYKRVKRHKHMKRCHHMKRNKNYEDDIPESKLDTLIRRTKERERKLLEQSRRKRWCTSTPIQKGFSPSVGCTEMDVSINSLSTLVLETRSCAYSPSASCLIDDLHQSSETEKLSYRAYSLSSPTKDYKFLSSASNDHKLVNVKNKTMNIEAYSPTHSTNDFSPKSCFIPKLRVKKGIKSEPLFSPGLSPINYEESNPGLQFCKIESVKSEKCNN